MNVRLTEEQKIKILNSKDIYKIMRQVLLRQNTIRRNQEHFWVLGLNNENTILFAELVSIGAVNRVHVSPPDVFRMGIYKLAVKMILVHNHPSGSLRISDTDKDFTDKMIKVGKMIDIDVIDHLIITDKRYVSFKDRGLMEELRNSGMYQLVKRETEAIKAFKIEIEKKKAAKDNSLEIAKRLKDLGSDINFIKKATGLTKREIDKV